jgi:hypothetical protein
MAARKRAPAEEKSVMLTSPVPNQGHNDIVYQLYNIFLKTRFVFLFWANLGKIFL